MTQPLTIRVRPTTALAFAAANDEERRKIEVLLDLQLQDLLATPSGSLKQLMVNIGREAQAQGLTMAGLESILHDE